MIEAKYSLIIYPLLVCNTEAGSDIALKGLPVPLPGLLFSGQALIIVKRLQKTKSKELLVFACELENASFFSAIARLICDWTVETE